MATDKEITRTQAALIIGVSEGRVSQLISKGVLKAYRTTTEHGNDVRTHLIESEVREYKAQRKNRVPVPAA